MFQLYKYVQLDLDLFHVRVRGRAELAPPEDSEQVNFTIFERNKFSLIFF